MDNKKLLLEKENNKIQKYLKMAVAFFFILIIVITTLIVLMYRDYIRGDEVLYDSNGNRSIEMSDGSAFIVDKNGNGTIVYEESYYEYSTSMVNRTASIIKSHHKKITTSQFQDSEIASIQTDYRNLSIIISEYNANPITKEDYIFEEYVSNVLYYYDQLAYYGYKYVETRDSTYRQLYNDYYKDALHNYKILVDLQTKYY